MIFRLYMWTPEHLLTFKTKQNVSLPSLITKEVKTGDIWKILGIPYLQTQLADIDFKGVDRKMSGFHLSNTMLPVGTRTRII